MLDQATLLRRSPCLALSTVIALCLAAPARGEEATARAPEAPAPDTAAAAPTTSAPPAPAPATSDVRPANADPSGGPRPAAGAPDATHRVIYVPELVKAELRKEIEEAVLARAKAEGWAVPGVIAEWLRRIRPSGDLRARWERDLFANGNGGQTDFNAINTNKPFDVNPVDYANDRYLDVDRDRSRPRLRARLGLDADVSDGFTVGLRLASGDTSAPISTNQTLGGTGGNFSKYQLWLDRAFVRWAPAADAVTVDLGRFENPFFRTKLIWDENVNFDGVALRAGGGQGAGFRPFLTGGAFPLYATGLNFPALSAEKLPSRDRWLYAVQLGAAWRPSDAVGLKLGAAYYYFHHVQGRASSPCDTNLKDITCDTDDDRPSFAQRGNTYMQLRTPSAAALAAEATGLASRYEYFGLASLFRVLDATARLDLRLAPPLKLTVEGEAVRNLGFSARRIEALAVNNRAQCDTQGNCARFAGGRDGLLGRVALGSPGQDRQGGWNVSVAYRYLESDATVDAFPDSDFGLGGTNLKGYVLSGGLAVADGIFTEARWFSADEIAGPRYRVDVLQLDLQARF